MWSDFGHHFFPYVPVDPSDEGQGGVEEEKKMKVDEQETGDDDEPMGDLDDGYNADGEGNKEDESDVKC